MQIDWFVVKTVAGVNLQMQEKHSNHTIKKKLLLFHSVEVTNGNEKMRQH